MAYPQWPPAPRFGRLRNPKPESSESCYDAIDFQPAGHLEENSVVEECPIQQTPHQRGRLPTALMWSLLNWTFFNDAVFFQMTRWLEINGIIARFRAFRLGITEPAKARCGWPLWIRHFKWITRILSQTRLQ